MPDLELAVSATTRERREGEENGREYWFISDEEFDQKLAAGEFLEYVEFPWGQRSGTLRSEIDRIKSHGRIPLLDLEPQGALDVKRTVPGACHDLRRGTDLRRERAAAPRTGDRERG